MSTPKTTASTQKETFGRNTKLTPPAERSMSTDFSGADVAGIGAFTIRAPSSYQGPCCVDVSSGSNRRAAPGLPQLFRQRRKFIQRCGIGQRVATGYGGRIRAEQ